ncbi:MAG TPA: hypothetical protein VGH50_08670 [Candidatus Binatia bacterium]
MLSPEFKERLARSHAFLLALWGVLLALCAVAGMLPARVFQHLPPLADSSPYLDSLDELIWAIAIGTAALLLWSRSRFYSVEQVFNASRRPREVPVIGESPTEMAASRLVHFYRSRMINAFALAASLALYGVLLAVVEADDYQWRLFCVTAVAMLVLFYPSRVFFDALLKEYERRETMREWR